MIEIVISHSSKSLMEFFRYCKTTTQQCLEDKTDVFFKVFVLSMKLKFFAGMNIWRTVKFAIVMLTGVISGKYNAEHFADESYDHHSRLVKEFHFRTIKIFL